VMAKLTQPREAVLLNPAPDRLFQGSDRVTKGWIQ
jgi:hypothetical protein